MSEDFNNGNTDLPKNLEPKDRLSPIIYVVLFLMAVKYILDNG